MSNIEIERAAEATDEVRTLVGELEATLSAHYAAHQRHGLKLEAIFQPHIRFYVARLDGTLAGCGGVAFLDGFAEVKRMYVREAVRGRGVAQAVLDRLQADARAAAYTTLRLETGDRQVVAMKMYERAGFRRCQAFGDYLSMPAGATETSVFMEMPLRPTLPL